MGEIQSENSMNKYFMYIILVSSLATHKNSFPMRKAFKSFKSKIKKANSKLPEEILALQLKRKTIEDKIEKLSSEVNSALDPFFLTRPSFPEPVRKNKKTLLAAVYYKMQYQYPQFDNLILMWHLTNNLLEIKEAEIDGCSTIGLTTFIKNIPLQHKKILAQLLLNHGFVPTKEDRELAYLELYERTTEATKKRMLLLAGHMKNPESDFARLPKDVIQTHIAPYLTDEEPIIPRKYCKSCPKIRQLE